MRKIIYFILICVPMVIFGQITNTIYPPGYCPFNDSIYWPLSGITREYLASMSITANNIITDGADIHIGADQNIHLLTGFKVVSGSKFLADLNGCGYWMYDGNSEIRNGQKKENNLVTPEIIVEIYPNPTDGIINISTKDNESQFQLIIYDYSGKILISKKLDSNTAQFDLTSYGRGIYLIKVQSLKINETKKVIIQ